MVGRSTDLDRRTATKTPYAEWFEGLPDQRVRITDTRWLKHQRRTRYHRIQPRDAINPSQRMS